MSHTEKSKDSEKEEDLNEKQEQSWVEDEEESEEDSWSDESIEEGDWDPSGEYVSQDYAKHFRTNQMWDTQEDLYSWASDIAEGLMMVLVKLDSNACRITMVCERFSRLLLLPTHQIRNSKTKKRCCKFEIIGLLTDKDSKIEPPLQPQNKKWVIYVIEGRHNHKISKTFHGNPSMSHMTLEEQLATKRCGDGRKKPCVIGSEPENVTSKEQVINFLNELKYEDHGELTSTQWSMKFLLDHDYVIYPILNTNTKVVEIVFFAHKESLQLLKKFPYMVVIDNTYKSNKYGMTLVQMIGFTCMHLAFNIGFAFTRAEATFHYTFIMKKLRVCYKEIGLMPTTIMTDSKKTLINGVKEVFGSEVQHLLCWVNIKHNIKARAYSILKREDKANCFANQCWELFSSHSEAVYEERLAKIRQSWKSGLVEYLDREWLNPYKENIVRAWTENHLHFFTKYTIRVEGMNNVMKEIIGSSRGGFNRVIVRIHHSIIQQNDKIRASMNVALSKKPIFFEDCDPKWVEGIFSPLFYTVSDRCFDLLLETFERVRRLEFTLKCTEYCVRKFQGLPCVHKIVVAIVNKTPLTPNDVHDFWKQLEWKDSSTTTIQSSSKELEDRRLRDMWSKLQRGTLKKSTTYQLGEMYHDLENPSQATFEDLSEAVKRGKMPPSPENKNIMIDKDISLLEHIGKKARWCEEEKGNEKTKENDQSQLPLKYLHTQDDTLPEEPVQPLVHLGVDFGVNNIDAFWIPYIIFAKDVRSDGHCGYRSLAVLLGKQEREYVSVRHAIASELLDNRDLYDPIRNNLFAGTWDQLIMQVNYSPSPCSHEHWLHMPFIGLVFATLYQVGLVLLTWHTPMLCLPLRARGENSAPPTRMLAMAHVGTHDHFIPITLRNGSPLPQTPRAWRLFGDQNIRWWEIEFNTNLESYRSYRIMNGRQPDL